MGHVEDSWKEHQARIGRPVCTPRDGTSLHSERSEEQAVTRQARHRITTLEDSGLCSRLLLAPAPRLQAGYDAENKTGVLGKETYSKQGARLSECKASPFVRVARYSHLGVPVP